MSPLAKILLAPLIAVLLVAAVPIVAFALIGWGVTSVFVSVAVSLLWLTHGTRFLVVYSESAQWKSYFEEEVVPAFGCSARVINLSRDGGTKKWWRLDWCIYQCCAGYRNRFPIVFRFSWFGPWKTVRFYDAYMLSKKGKTSALEKAKIDASLWYPAKP